MEPSPDFFPFVPGLVLEYQSKSPASSAAVVFEIIKVAEKGGVTMAQCRRTVRAGGREKVRDFTMTKDGTGVFSEKAKEFPLPAELGRKWKSNPRAYEIASVTSSVKVPAGQYKGCLKVTYLVADGDGGSGERFFAPGVGFIYESSADEADPFELALTRAVIP